MSARANNRAAVHYDDKVLSGTVTATSEAGNMLVSNLQTNSPSERWRSDDLADQTIICDAGESSVYNLLYLGGHNLSGNATLRVRISDESDLSSPVYDVTWDAFPSIYGLGEGGLGEFGLGGIPDTLALQDFQFFSCLLLDNIYEFTPIGLGTDQIILPKSFEKVSGATEYASDENDFYLGGVIEIVDGTGSGQIRNIASYNAATRKVTLDSAFTTQPTKASGFRLDMTNATKVCNDETYLGRYIGLTISDIDNTDGYIEAGVLKAGKYLQPEIDIDADWNVGYTDPSERFISYNYDIDVNERTKFRTANIQFSYLSESEVDEFAVTMAAQNGTSKPVIVIPFYEQSFRLFNNTVYGLLDEAPRKQQILQDYTNNAYQVTMNIRGL